MASRAGVTSFAISPTSRPRRLESARCAGSRRARWKAERIRAARATRRVGDGYNRACLARGVSDYRTADLPQQLLVDPAPQAWTRADRALRYGVDRMGRARAVLPLDRRIRGPSRRPRACP